MKFLEAVWKKVKDSSVRSDADRQTDGHCAGAWRRSLSQLHVPLAPHKKTCSTVESADFRIPALCLKFHCGGFFFFSFGRRMRDE